MRLLSRVVAIAAAALALASCASSPATSTSPAPSTAAGSSPSPSTPPATYGAATVLTGQAGTVSVAVGEPQAKTFHASVYDSTCKVHPANCDKPGKAGTAYVVLTTSWAGVSGTVDIFHAYGFEYELPDGTLVSLAMPIGIFEPFDSLGDHPTSVTAGQMVTGEIAFQTSNAGGRLVVVPAGGGPSVTFVRSFGD